MKEGDGSGGGIGMNNSDIINGLGGKGGKGIEGINVRFVIILFIG